MKEPIKPAYIKGILWFLFSGTAMLSAVILPVHIWALMTGHVPEWWTTGAYWPSPIILRVYFIVLSIAALYHGLYRTKTIVFDLGFTKATKPVGILCTILFLIGAAYSTYLFGWVV